MSINQNSSLRSDFILVQKAIRVDRNLSDDQKLVLTISDGSSCESGKTEVEKSNRNVNVVILSGRSSPCDDHLDSGTCSDAEINQTPPPLPPKLIKRDNQMLNILHESSCSNTSTSSSLSSDSNQFNQQNDSIIAHAQSHLVSPNLIRSLDEQQKALKSDSNLPLPTSLLRDIRLRSIKPEVGEIEQRESSSPDELNYADLDFHDRENGDDNLIIKLYCDDKFYKFHLNEHSPNLNVDDAMTQDESDESFAGLKDLRSRSSTIRSTKGTIRGVKNRVRNGIATFLQMQQTTVKVSCRIRKKCCTGQAWHVFVWFPEHISSADYWQFSPEFLLINRLN